MLSARDHPFNQSRRPLLECRPGGGGGQMNSHHLAHDDEEEDDADYEDIRNNNTTPTTNTSSDLRCDFKTYGFVRKFTKAPALASSSHNEKSSSRNIYNGFNDFNAIPRATGEDGVGYPYGEKIINDKQPIGGAFREPKEADFMFQQYSNNNSKYLNNQQQTQSHYQHPATTNSTLTRKLNNTQHVNLHNNQFNQQKIGNRCEPDFANRPLPQTPPPTAGTPLLARQRPVPGGGGAEPQRAVCPTPPLCRANRKGPFIFGVDSQHTRTNSNSSQSSPAPSPLLRRQPHQQQQVSQPAPVIEQWKYSENSNNNAPDLLSQHQSHRIDAPGTPQQQSAIRRREVFQRTQNGVIPQTNHHHHPPHDTLWDPNKEIWEDKQKAKQQQLKSETKKKQQQKKKCKKSTTTTTTLKTNTKAGGSGEGGATVKCVIVGDAAVGKTNLIISYLENRFVQEHIPTASDIYNGEVEVDGSPIHVTLCDTAGQNTTNASALREICSSGSDVFLVCFSVVNPETFRSVQTNWIPTLTKQHRNASVILIGTQSDLRTDQSTIAYLQMQGEKPVSQTDAWDYARSIGAKYVESSSRTKDKVKDAFDTAIWDALLSQQQQSIKKPFWRRLFCLA